METILEGVRQACGAIRVEDLHLDRAGRRSLARLVVQGKVHRRSARVVSLPGAKRWVVMCRLAKGVLTCRWALRHYGLPVIGEPGCAHVAITGHRVDPGVVIPGVGEVDLLVDRWFIVETDGYAFHSKPEDWTRDRVRGQGLLYQGRVHVRLTYDDVMAGRTVDVVELAMAGARAYFGGLQRLS